MKATPRGWTIGRTLLTITIVPPLVMLVLVATTLYFVRLGEIRGDIDDRGRLVAGALAATSQYGVVSGNIASLDHTIRSLLESDASIAVVDILDAQRRPLVSVRAAGASTDNTFVFERPVNNQALLVDLFDGAGPPHVSDALASGALAKQGTTVGYVRVIMSPAPLLEAKQRGLYLTGALLTVAGLVGLGVGLLFVGRLRRPLSQVLRGLRDMRSGNFSLPITVAAPGELGQLQATLVEVAAALATTTLELEAKVSERTLQLELANVEKRELIVRGNHLLEEERKRIALEIHDSMNASLIVLKLHTQCILDLAAHSSDELAGREIERIARDVTATTDAIYVVARNIIKQLRPEVIDTLGLTAALAEMVRTVDELQPECTFELRVDDAFPTMQPEVEITAYRLVQEALSNVVKHAQARAVVVRLACSSDPAEVCIIVADDGQGFDIGVTQPGGLGLVGMRERVQAIGGTMHVRSMPGSGTELAFSMPRQI